MLYNFFKFCENISKGFRVIERTRFQYFSLNVSKGHNSVQNVGGVTVLVLCTSSDCAIIFIKFCESISKL